MCKDLIIFSNNMPELTSDPNNYNVLHIRLLWKVVSETNDFLLE